MVGGVFGLFAFVALAVRAAIASQHEPARRSAWRKEAVLFSVLAIVMAAALATPFVLQR